MQLEGGAVTPRHLCVTLPVILGSYLIQWLWDETWLNIPGPYLTICLTLNKFPNPSEVYSSSLGKWRYSFFLFCFPTRPWAPGKLGHWPDNLCRQHWHQPSSTCLLNCQVVGGTELDSPPKSPKVLPSAHVPGSFLQESSEPESSPLQFHWR